MSAKKFVQLLEASGALDPSTLREVRRQVSEKKVSAATIAKALVEKGKLTKFQATKLVGEATAADTGPSNDDESGFLLAEDVPADDEVVLLEEAAADEPEEVVGLTPVEDAGAALTPVGGAPPSIGGGLEPLDSGGLESLDAFDGSGGLDSLDPFAQPTQAVPAAGEDGSGKKKRREKKNQQDWGGKLMIGGGGFLLFLILAGTLLYITINKKGPVELFNEAEEAYRGESYSDAMAKFERFVKNYSSDDNADDAQVRIVLCRIRIVIGDPQKAYDKAIELLPTVQDLEAFSTARDELATLLPTIPEGFIKKAKQAADTDAMEEMIGKAEKAMADLVNKPEYIPASKRPAERLKRIVEDIKIVRRAISQERDLATAIAQIKEHAAASKTEEAYQVYEELLEEYPGVVDDEGLQSSVLEITAKLANLVKPQEEAVAALTEDVKPVTEYRVILASRSTDAGQGVPRLNGQVVALLAAGAVYGLDAGTGGVLWQRYVGHVTKHHPQPLSAQADADILITDAHRSELVRVKASGEPVWRLAIGENFAAPSIAGDQIYVTTHSGNILQVDAASGNSARRVAIPQLLEGSAGVAQIHPYLIQLGDHSNLYVISRESLACQEVIYIGHKAGTIVTPPLIIQDHVLIAENAGRDYCKLHIFKITPGDGPLLRRPQAPIRLTGNVIVPMILDGRRPLVVTDLGEVNVFNIDFNAAADTVTTATAALPASRAAPLLSYPVLEGKTLVLADDKLVKYELQISLKQITQRSVTSRGDTCIAPPRLYGDILIVTRRKAGSVGATVSALQVDNLRKAEWETQIGIPISRAEADGTGKQLDVISAAGARYVVDGKVLQAGVSNEPAVTATTTGGALSFTDQVQFASGKVAFFNPANNAKALIYTPGTGSGGLQIVDLKLAGAKVTCVPVAFQDGLLAPLNNGSVLLANTATGDNLVLPFQPELAPGEDVIWQRPAVLGEEFVIVDDRKNIYRIGIKQQPKPFLAPIASGKLEFDIDSDLAAAGDTIYGVVRNTGGDVIVALNAGDLQRNKEFALTGRVVWGPVQVGNAVLCLSSQEGLLCLEAGANQRWANSAGCGGQPAGVPLEVAGDFVIAVREGSVVRIAGANGQQVAEVTIGEPLGASPVAFGSRLLLPGSDGALHVIPMPNAPMPNAPMPNAEGQ
ncbi:MAG: PQQ-binding-like beta-propeller repeat protein [Planctomycetota bacterium]|nr:PQQ-binding-like beta-propeller repeat protein [Planctomycetota bacterium]